MSAKRPRVIVIGGGTQGLAAAWALARRGAEVELFERFEHVHDRGSHGGHTRAIRHAYHEGSDYVRLVVAADREWTALGERVDQELLVRCGLLEFGSPDDPEFAAALAALREHELEHELLDAAAARARFPIEMPAGWQACLSPGAGYLRVRACLDALRREAEAAGARLRYGARCRELILGRGQPGVLLDEGSVISADYLVVAAGAFTHNLLPGVFDPPLKVLRRVLAWTRPEDQSGEAIQARAALPVWAGFVPEGFFYGFPDHGEGLPDFKLACHEARDPSLADMYDPCDPEKVDREVHERDLQPLRAFMNRYMPALAGSFTASATCLYTNTANGDFWIDRHPRDGRVVVATGFSGHGFKFAPVIGLAIAQILLDGRSDLALDRFSRRAHAARGSGGATSTE